MFSSIIFSLVKALFTAVYNAITFYICRPIVAKLKEPSWIGLNDINNEEKWHWIDDVRSFLNSSIWYRGQPDNMGNNQDCAVFKWARRSKSDDQDCQDRKFYGLHVRLIKISNTQLLLNTICD